MTVISGGQLAYIARCLWSNHPLLGLSAFLHIKPSHMKKCLDGASSIMPESVDKVRNYINGLIPECEADLVDKLSKKGSMSRDIEDLNPGEANSLGLVKVDKKSFHNIVIKLSGHYGFRDTIENKFHISWKYFKRDFEDGFVMNHIIEKLISEYEALSVMEANRLTALKRCQDILSGNGTFVDTSVRPGKKAYW